MHDGNPAKMQNCLLPLQRVGQGWRRGTMQSRVATALHSLLTIKQKDLPWAPSFGWLIDELRTQGVTDEAVAALEALLAGAIATWIPYINFVGISVDAPPDQERLGILVSWYWPPSQFRRETAEPKVVETLVMV